MPTLTITKQYLDDNIFTEAMLDAFKSSIETLINTTKLDSTNIQTGGIVLSNLSTSLQASLWVTGDIKLRGTATVPSGWLACDGAAVSRTTYATLFSEIGTTWGAGNGTTTFNLPDAQGRAAIGSGSGSGLTTRALGALVGAETLPAHTHTFTSGNQSASHTHSGTTGTNSVNHTHTYPSSDAGGGTGGTGASNVVAGSTTALAGNGNVLNSNTTGVLGYVESSYENQNHTHAFTSGNQSADHTHGGTTDSTGTGSHGVMQPSAAYLFIIKT